MMITAKDKQEWLYYVLEQINEIEHLIRGSPEFAKRHPPFQSMLSEAKKLMEKWRPIANDTLNEIRANRL